jgi:hypothetical protein
MPPQRCHCHLAPASLATACRSQQGIRDGFIQQRAVQGAQGFSLGLPGRQSVAGGRVSGQRASSSARRAGGNWPSTSGVDPVVHQFAVRVMRRLS